MDIIEIIKNHQHQIDALLKIKESKDYLGVGLKVDVTTIEENPISMVFSTYSGIEEQLLDVMISGLETAKNYWIKNLMEEKHKIEYFLKNNKK